MKNQTLVILLCAVAIWTATHVSAVPQSAAGSAAASTTKTEAEKKVADLPPSELKFLPAEALALNIDLKNPGGMKAQVAVQSSAKDSYKPDHSLDSMGFVDSEGNQVNWDQAIEIRGAKPVLSAGESEHLALAWKPDSNVRPGTYEGFLVVSRIVSGDKKEVGRQLVKVVVPDPLTVLQPLVSKLNLRVYRLFPFAPFWCMPAWMNSGIPLRAPLTAATAGLTRRPLLAATTRDFVGLAPIYWDKNETTLKSNSEPVLGLQIGSIPYAGKYDGVLNLGKDAGSGVAFTLNASDLPIYPLLWVALCLWIATWGKRWLGGERQLTDWRTHVLKAQKQMQAAEQKFSATVTGPARAYSIHDAFNAQCQAIWGKIDELHGGLLGTLDTSSPAYTFVNTKIPDLEGFSSAWGTFGEQLEALKLAMAGVVPGIPPLGLHPRPAVLEFADTLLQPQKLTLVQFAAQQSAVSALTTFLPLWSQLWSRVQQMHQDLADFKSDSPDYVSAHTDDVKAVNDEINLVRARVWLLNGADDAVNKTTVADVESAEEKPSALLEAANFEKRKPSANAIAGMRRPGQPPHAQIDWTAPDVSLADLQKQLTGTDTALGILSFVLAVLTGLNQLYFGKPFGTVSDYVTLTLWAFGTKVAVDALSGGLERWVGSQNSR